MNGGTKKLRSRRQAKKLERPRIIRQIDPKNGKVKFTVSKDGVPQFLIEAKKALDAGRPGEIAKLLNDENIEVVRQIIAKDPSRIDVMLALAMLLYSIRRSDEAEDCYKKLLEREPNVLAYHDLGNICREDGRLSQALEYRRKVVQVSPDNGDFLFHLGHILMELDQVQEGMDLLQRAVGKCPTVRIFTLISFFTFIICRIWTARYFLMSTDDGPVSTPP